MRLKRDVSKLRVLDCKDHVLRFVRAAYGNSERPRVEREGMETKNGARDDAERAESTGNELWKIVAGNIFYDFAPAGGERAIRKCNGNPDDEVAERAKAQAERATVVSREDAADRGFLRPKRIECETLAMVRERFLQGLNGAPSFDGDREVGPGVFNNAVESRSGENDVGARRRIAPAKFGAASTRNYHKASLVCEAECVCEL